MLATDPGSTVTHSGAPQQCAAIFLRLLHDATGVIFLLPAWAVDVCATYFANPCVVRSCINDGKGSYSCVCPPGFYSGTTLEGSPSCSLAENGEEK